MAELVTRLRPAATADGWGDETSDFAGAAELTFTALGVAPGDTIEANDNRLAVEIDLVIYVPSAVDIDAADRLVIRGDTYEVVGTPADWRSPFTGRQFGREVNVRRVTG